MEVSQAISHPHLILLPLKQQCRCKTRKTVNVTTLSSQWYGALGIGQRFGFRAERGEHIRAWY